MPPDSSTDLRNESLDCLVDFPSQSLRSQEVLPGGITPMEVAFYAGLVGFDAGVFLLVDPVNSPIVIVAKLAGLASGTPGLESQLLHFLTVPALLFLQSCLLPAVARTASFKQIIWGEKAP